MRVLVTGGGGFLGSWIVRSLARRGDAVRVLARGDYPILRALGVETLRGDIRNRADVEAACQGVDLVFHVAARPGMWGDPAEFESINVGGTQNVVAACRHAGVGYLVYTSSPSVVHAGTDQEGIDESAPYPEHHHGHYPRTKAAAERHVLAANGPDLRTIALRPHLVWGPGDNHILPRLVARAKAGKLRRIGPGDPLIDSTWIENAVDAHLLAAEKLRSGAPVGGKAYFITNGEPIGCWTLIGRLIDAAGAPPIRGSIPLWAAKLVGAGLEAAYGTFHLKGEPQLTRFVVSEMATAHWFDISAARRDLGYEPRVSIDEGIARLSAWYRETTASAA